MKNSLTVLVALAIVLASLPDVSYGEVQGALVQKIVFVSDRLGDEDIWMMNLDGSNQEPLIAWSGSNETTPDISPDGTRLAFVSNRDADYELFIYDFTSKTTYKVPTGLGWCWQPDWSPDSSHIAMAGAPSYTLCGPEIYTVKPDGSDLVRWTNNGITDVAPDYSPDGQTIVFERLLTCFLTYSSEIFKLYLPSGTTERCTFTGSAGEKDINFGPQYSPDGNSIIWEGGDRVTTDHQIWIMDSTCGNPQILGGLPNRLEREVCFSPAGDSIVYRGRYIEPPANNIYKAPLDMSSEAQLTFDGSNSRPVWGYIYSEEAAIPTLTEWGMIIFAALLLGFMAYTVIRRRKSIGVGV